MKTEHKIKVLALTAIAVITALSLNGAEGICMHTVPGDCISGSCSTGGHTGYVSAASQVDNCEEGSPGNQYCDYTGDHYDCVFSCTYTAGGQNFTVNGLKCDRQKARLDGARC